MCLRLGHSDRLLCGVGDFSPFLTGVSHLEQHLCSSTPRLALLWRSPRAGCVKCCSHGSTLDKLRRRGLWDRELTVDVPHPWIQLLSQKPRPRPPPFLCCPWPVGWFLNSPGKAHLWAGPTFPPLTLQFAFLCWTLMAIYLLLCILTEFCQHLCLLVIVFIASPHCFKFKSFFFFMFLTS